MPFAGFEDVDNVPDDRIVRSPDGRVVLVTAAVERIADVVPVDARKRIGRPAKIARVSIARPFAEAELYRSQLDASIAAHTGYDTPTWAVMRHTAVYDSADQWMVPVEAAQRQLSQFENLFKNLGDVQNGFPRTIPMDQVANAADYEPVTLSENLVFGTPDEVVAKLRRYQELGVDEFVYYASLGLGLTEQKRSMELFCSEVIPAFT